VTTAHASVLNEEFPDSTSTIFDASNEHTSSLGVGGGEKFFAAGTSISETFASGLSTITSSSWKFSMSDATAVGVTSNFDVLINGIIIGNCALVGTGNDAVRTDSFDLSFAGVPITVSGPTFTLSILATDTVPQGDGSYD
jgi:hypothetical protein